MCLNRVAILLDVCRREGEQAKRPCMWPASEAERFIHSETSWGMPERRPQNSVQPEHAHWGGPRISGNVLDETRK